MFFLRVFVVVFSVIAITLMLPIEEVFSDPLCIQSCAPLTSECDHTGTNFFASFEDFSTSSTIFNGEVCHPNKNFKFYVTTSLFGSTTSSYQITNFPEPVPPINQDPRYYNTFVSGHPYYKIKFEGNLDPAISNFSAGVLTLGFVNDFITNTPTVYVEIFDENDNSIYSANLSPSFATPYGAAFSVAPFFAIPSQISHIHISTTDKYGLISIDFTGL